MGSAVWFRILMDLDGRVRVVSSLKVHPKWVGQFNFVCILYICFVEFNGSGSNFNRFSKSGKNFGRFNILCHSKWSIPV